ncbi:hypothetical protein EVAR_23750_1 [Eumeta japonica]|uniref:Uncharacterized protein n=1 Tax=Eumeta variegata TaxID=151549 RepID=A0A4C1VGW3_EUMVA|nr:hypothetical protein EVAR_23750_1 [Eumeta japonica]
MHELTRSARGARPAWRSGTGPSSPGSSRLRECEYNHRIHLRHKPSRTRPTPTGANAGRPARVCAAEHARRALRFARCAPDRPAHYL